MTSSKLLWIVTGAAGFIGNTVVRALVDAGERVRACDVGHGTPESLAGVDCEYLQFDVRDPSAVRAAFEHESGTRVFVLHCAGIVSITDKVSPQAYSVNVEGTQNVIEACRDTGVERFVYVSSVHALPEPDPPTLIVELDRAEDFEPERVFGAYAQTKAEATQRVFAADDLWRVVAHPSGVIGPGDFGDTHLSRLIRDVASGRLRATVAGGYDFVDVRDVAHGIIAAAERGQNGRGYILSGHFVRMRDLTRMIAKLSGIKNPATVFPMWLARLTAPLVELYYKLRKTNPLYSRYSLHTLHTPADFSHERAAQELGYAPRPLKQTLADAVRWLKARDQTPRSVTEPPSQQSHPAKPDDGG